MNGPNPPLRADALDELLSADLDGELTRAAADRGLSLDDARAALATPEALARRGALERARDLVAPVPPLDPAAVDELVTGALTQADRESPLAAVPRRRDRFDTARRVTIAAASVAAVVAGVALLVRMGGGTGPSKSASSSAGPEATAASPAPRPPNLGDVSSPGALRAAVLGRVARLPVPARQPAPVLDAPQASTGPQGASGSLSPEKGRSEFATAARPQGPRSVGAADSNAVNRRATRTGCVARLIGTGRVPPAPVLVGDAVSEGRPVYVVVFRSSGAAYDVYVLAPASCAVVRHTTVA